MFIVLPKVPSGEQQEQIKLFKETNCTLCTPPAPLQKGAAPPGRSVRKVVGSQNSVLTRKFLKFVVFERCFEPVGHRPVEEVVHVMDVHVKVLGGLHDEVDVPLLLSPL